MTEKIQPIPHRLKNMSVGGHVAGAEDIDAGNGKTQQEVNADTYRKDETYSKEQLDNMITTPEQEYKSVVATSSTSTLADVAALIAARYPDDKEKADTIYRVGNWDGTQYNTGAYSEYTWDGEQYVFMSKKEPGIDDEPTPESDNLVKSGGIDIRLTDIKGTLKYSTAISVDSGISYIEFPIDIKSGRTVYIDFNTNAEVETCRIYANTVETEKLIPYGGSISVKNLVFTPSFNVNKIIVYLSNTTVGGDFEAVIRFSDSLEDAKGGINNIEKFISQSNQDLTGIVYTPFKSIDASNGNLTEDTKSFVCDYIAIDPSVSRIVYWNWGKNYGSTPGAFVFALYDENKTFLKSYNSSANAVELGINFNNDPDVRYIRASFSIQNIYGAYLKDHYRDMYLFKLVKEDAQRVVDSIKKLGIALSNSLDYSDVVGVKCVKVENVDIKAGTKVNVQVKTDKAFTRFMVGFNATYASAGNLYKNFYNNNTIDYTFVADVDLTSLWLYLVSAEDTDMVADYTIVTGAYLQSDDITIDSDLVVMPENTYILSDVENSIYHSNYMKYVSDKLLVSQGGTGWRFLQRCFRVNRQNNVALSIIIRDREKLSPLRTFNTQTIVGSKSIDVAKKVNAIGDSFTYNGYWYQHIANLVDGLSFVGMRKSYGCEEPLRGEGRGGWTLANYFQPHNSVVPTSMQPFSPFMHVSGYTYYGVIDFWKVIVNGTSQYVYGTNGFDDYKSWFDTDGYKVNPQVNDLMYDGENDKYVYYNGSSWEDYDGTPDFVFDYTKYITTWNIASPDIVIVMLGKNDFQNSSTSTDFSTWKSKMDTLITSVQDYAESVNKTIYIGICTPTTANQAPNNSPNYVVPEIGGRNMWNARKYIIDTYDNDTYREDGVYVVDSGICLDPEYGFPLRADKPFEWYEGDEKELISINGVHPSNGGYAQIGTCVGGWIQYLRSL